MKGGYLQDRFDNGGAFEDAYQIFHWNTVDVFIYFSHTLVTIPPRTWIAACRHNGALALGTFITE
jgi:mannosyl-glycoprotein endo-beta-N-acetylglucosaminidase